MTCHRGSSLCERKAPRPAYHCPFQRARSAGRAPRCRRISVVVTSLYDDIRNATEEKWHAANLTGSGSCDSTSRRRCMTCLPYACRIADEPCLVTAMVTVITKASGHQLKGCPDTGGLVRVKALRSSGPLHLQSQVSTAFFAGRGMSRILWDVSSGIRLPAAPKLISRDGV